MKEPSSPTGDSMVTAAVVSENLQDDVPIELDRWEALARAVLEHEQAVGELTLTFVDRDEITMLKREHFGDPGAVPTDVLAFPLDDEFFDPTVPKLLGDVVVCPAVALEQCAHHAGTLDDELALLVVHGILHILGHDHDEPSATETMRMRELMLLELLHWHGKAPAGFRQTHDEEVV